VYICPANKILTTMGKLVLTAYLAGIASPPGSVKPAEDIGQVGRARAYVNCVGRLKPKRNVNACAVKMALSFLCYPPGA